MRGVNPVHTFNRRLRLDGRSQMIDNVDTLDHQDLVVFFDLACDLSRQPATACINLACLQRAPEGSGQSTGGGGDDVIDGGGVRLGYRFRVYSVVPGDSSVHPEPNGFRFGW
jgi:hypothetical protein